MVLNQPGCFVENLISDARAPPERGRDVQSVRTLYIHDACWIEARYTNRRKKRVANEREPGRIERVDLLSSIGKQASKKQRQMAAETMASDNDALIRAQHASSASVGTAYADIAA